MEEKPSKKFFISKLIGITLVIIIFVSILFPVFAFTFSISLANIFAGTSNGDEPLIMGPFCLIIPVIFALVIAILQKK